MHYVITTNYKFIDTPVPVHRNGGKIEDGRDGSEFLFLIYIALENSKSTKLLYDGL